MRPPKGAAVVPLLLLFVLAAATATRRRISKRGSKAFVFTLPVYNATISENARGKVFAEGDGPANQMMGVHVMPDPGQVRFKIVQGDTKQYFKAHARMVGDFAFLRIRLHPQADVMLNRELKDHYQFLIKATFRREGKRNLETTTVVNLRVADQNDLTPLFLPSDYVAEIGEDTAPFSQIVQVSASDADDGLNGQVYFSLVEASADFAVHPVSGVVTLLRRLSAGRYSLTVRAEDRASRLFYGNAVGLGPGRPPSEAAVTVTVVKANIFPPTIAVETKPIDVYSDKSQLVAILRISDQDEKEHGKISRVQIVRRPTSDWFVLRPDTEANVFLLETLAGADLSVDERVTVDVQAIDAGTPELSTTASVVVQLLDQSRPSMVFAREFAFAINESSPLLTILGFVTANVSKPHVNLVKYSIVGDSDTFRINEKTGLLHLHGPLDFELTKQLQVTVRAALDDVTADTSVLVDVLDSNDNNPQFAANWAAGQAVAVSRDLAVESTVVTIIATDRDSGDNGRVSFRLANEDQNPFLVDHYTGEVKLHSPLPLKDTHRWKLLIRASDRGAPLQRESELSLWIYVNGTTKPTTDSNPIRSLIPNLHAPSFVSELYETSVVENAVTGTVVTTVVATDADWGHSAWVQYALQLDGNELGHFTVDTLTGELRVLKPFTSPGTHDLVLTATDAGLPPKSTTTKIRVSVTDINDHAPVFDRPIYRATVVEDGQVGATVLQVVAVDADVGENGNVRYRLATKTDDFKIDAVSGVLSVTRPLDRELKDQYDLMITAFDLGSPSLSSDTNASVTVLDYNDNSPRCLQKVHKVQIAEDWPQGALLTCVGAEDVDAGENGRVSFELDSTRSDKDLPFRIDAKSGCVFIDSPQPLDFEKRPLYNLTVEVSDNGQPQFSTICSLLVELIDVNENQHPPVFDDFVLEASVLENEPIGTEVTTVKATDPDDPTSRVTYAIVGGDGLGLFAIDGRGTVRTTSALDRETQAHYWLAIAAQDTANVPLSSVVHLYVSVNDTNDNAPRPDKPIYFASVAENSPENTVVVKVEATDADDPTADVRYRISRGDPQSFFAIDPKTGYITTQGRRHLDRETNKEHELEVTISDRGEPRLSTPVLVVVAVTDTNDNPPVFKQPIYNFNVPSANVGLSAGGRIPLCRVFAADADEGINARLYYNISDGESHFAIDEKGELSTTRQLQGGQSFALTVQATDMGFPPKSATTRVMLDVVATPSAKKNNRKPTLPAGDWSELHISDADSVGETIGLIDASDEDEDVLWWSIVDGNINDTFALRRDTGELLLAKPLDYANLSAFDIEYSVSDGVATSRGKIKVHVSKSKQVRPEFSAVHYRAQMAESAPIGTTVAKVSAALPGLDAKAKSEFSAEKISYSLHSADSPISSEKFRVDPRTGNVVLVETLDHETQKEHHLIIAARCGSLVNLASVSIEVGDENDSAPRFLSSHYEAKVFATAAVGTLIVTIQAHDSDSGQNAALTYAISSGNELGMFSLDTATGAIMVAKQLSLDYPETMLAVRVTDGGKPPMSDTSTVRILTVMDESSPPRFFLDPYTLSVKESEPVGTQIGTVYAESAAGVRYQMEKPLVDEFEVHPASGAIFLARKLDREQSTYLNFTVVAVGSAGGSSWTRVQVTVADANDHAPVFVRTVYAGAVLENMPAGTPVLLADGTPLVVSATDADSGPNALVNYKIATPWADDYFSVDFGTGAIRTKVPLDFELTKSFSFAVRASDMGSPAMTSPVAAYITVKVKDSNDEKPMLVPQHISATLSLPTAKGVILARATAVDVDSVGELRYSISDEQASRLFAIDRLHGTISVATADAAQFTAKEYTIAISVSDGIHSTDGSVAVHVVDYSAKTTGSSLRFKKSAYQVSVVENTTSTQPLSIQTLTVVGAELGERITYHLLNPTDGFALGTSSGELKTTGVPLDREKTPNVTLIVQARDQRVPPRIAQTVITVDINDTNDCMPRFVNLPYYAVVPLDSNLGEKVIKVNAIDDDKGPNGQVRYSLVDSVNGRFTINSWDGRITVAKAFPSGMATQDYTLVVEAKDQGTPPLMSRTEVNVSIVNRAMPVFKRRYYKSELSEATPVGSKVTTVNAESNVGGKIGYVITTGDYDNQFDVDFDTGAILVRKSLDREKVAFYNVTVLAVDVGRNGIAAEAIVSLIITDENDNAPRFVNKTFEVFVAESTPVGTVIDRLEAIDADLDDGGAITYRIEGADASEFNVDLQNGDLFVAKRLDFEKKSRYAFKVIASDGGQPSLSTEAAVVVTLIDVNDEAPVFAEFIFSSTVPDDALSDHFVAKMDVLDADTVSSLEGGHRLLYSVMDGDSVTPLFQVDRHTGVVRLTRDLQDVDVLTSRHKSVNVSATDGTFTTYAKLEVDLVATAFRSAPPRFEQSTYSPGAKENDPVGTPVITVQATGGAPPLKYSFGGKDASIWPVTIDPDSGKVFTREVLDYEVKREYRIPMMVEDAAGRKGFTTLQLNVLDVNDNAPIFVAKSYKATASSNATHGESVLIVLAVDPDAGDQVEYSVFDKDANENLHQFFKMNNRRGLLSVRKNLKPLEGQTLSFFVRATDRGNPPKQSEVVAELTIVDDATAVPKFSEEHYHMNVAENAPVTTAIGRLRQDDAAAVNGVRYAILPPPDALAQDMPFSVDPTSGTVSVVKQLDRESKDEWRFSVAMATDRATSVSVVTVRVDDVNDNAPKFEATYEKLSISEDAPVGTSVAIFSATDKDLDSAGKTIFSIEGADAMSGAFKVDGESGWLVVEKKLDRETKDLFEFSVRATDQGHPALSTVTRVAIAIIDANDCAPEFGNKKYQFQVDEGAQLGTVIGAISVSDKDLPPNNVTKLFIVGGNERQMFGLRDSGDLYVQKPLRSARAAPHRLVIVASDGRHSATAEAVVSVLASNDRPPQCERDFVELVVGEDAEVGAEVFLLVADDQDAGTQLKYSLNGDADKHFAFTDKGALVIAKPLDREIRGEYLLTLRATDTNGRSCTSTIAVSVADVNDEAPVFEKSSYSIAVKENMNITDDEAFFVLNVKALDGDTGAGGKVRYSLKADQDVDILQFFKMDELTGALLLVAPLDREDRLEYNITVLATDSDSNGPMSSSAEVRVSVVDVNDNPPVFERRQYSAETSEQEAAGYQVVQVHAVGGDHGETVTYQLVAPSTAIDYFQVNEASGAITLRKSLDFEKQKQYTLTVEATDSGTPPLTASTTVEITVLDGNDHSPKFTQTLYQATVEENCEIGTKVVQVIARDADSGEFGRLSYKLTSRAEQFAIDDNGWITVKSSIDRETMSAHRLTVEVSDGGHPPLTDSAAVVVVVSDKNDNPPIFAECNLTAVVQEGGQLGRQLLTTAISDADADPNAGPFQLKIEGAGAESFTFEEMTLKSTARLVYANKDIYLLTVTATDNGQPSMSSECPLTIYVREESKHPPELSPVHVSINSLMGEFPGALIARAHATDKDARDMLRYALVDREEYFSLNSQTGEISARQGLPGGIHRLNVSVTDGKFTTIASYTVEVEPIDQDALDHAVSIRFAQVSPAVFVSGPKHQFEKAVARILNVRPKNVRIVSLQEADESSPKKDRKRKKFRHRRHINSSDDGPIRDLDVLFTVAKGKERGYYRPNFVRQRLDEHMADLSRHDQLQVVAMVTEVCRRDLCVRGDCRDRLWLDDVDFYSIVTPEGAFVAPTHVRTYECICKDGYGGKRCDVPTNACSRDPCDADRMCVPKENAIGFDCACPPGTTGTSCQEQLCPDGDCTRGGAISLDGTGYVQYTLANPFDRRLELAIELKTVSSDGVLLHGRGTHDYHTLELHGGYLEYRWDCGAGPGTAKLLDVRVTDGKWHTVKISRRGRHSKLTLDDVFTVEGESPVGNDVINLHNNVGKLTFGAQVSDHPTLQGHLQVQRGFNGCLNRLYVDGFELPKSKQGLKLFNVEMGCRASGGGVCSSSPCENYGSCLPLDDGYSCSCHPRFSGRNCEIDLNPCASDPCPAGTPCQSLFNDFYCRCSPGLTGKTCQSKGDFDECVTSPCGPYGVCISVPRSYVCNCTNGWSGPTCREKPGPNLDANPWGWPITVLELIIIVVVLIVLLVLACLIVCVCRRTGRYRYHKAPYVQNNNDLMLETQPHVHNPLVSRSGFGGKFQDVPPPLPPRGSRGFHPHRNSKLSNLESAQLTGLPTVQVRPLSIHDRGAGCENSSGSPNGSRNWRPALGEDDGDTPASCRRMGERANLDSARNYGSAAEELEQLGRFGAHDILRTFGKPLPIEDEANMNRHDRMNRQELLDGLDRLSIDTIERLKERNRDMPDDDDRNRSLASSIQCLPTDDAENGAGNATFADCSPNARVPKRYHWDYSDWSSTMGNAKDDNGCELPTGVSALDETDSEFLADDDHITIPPMSATGDFRRELLKLQRLTKEANDVPRRTKSREEPASTSATNDQSEYMTMKPLIAQQRHLDKYLPKHRAPPDSTQSQRRPLLDTDADDMSQSSDSDGADSCDAVVQYGFPSQKKRRRNRVEHAADKALYDEPPRVAVDDSDSQSRVSSFKERLPRAASSDPMQCSMEGQLSNPRSTSDMSGICDIDDSEYAPSEHGQTKIISKQTVV